MNNDWTSDDDREIETATRVDDSSEEICNINWTSEDEREIEAAVHQRDIVERNDSNKEMLNINSNSDDEREIEAASAVHQAHNFECGSNNSNKEMLNFNWNSDDEREIEAASAVHQGHNFECGSNDSNKEMSNINWNSDDERKIEVASAVHQAHIFECGLSSSSTALPSSKAMDEFLNMGFSAKMIEKALKAHGTNDKEAVLEALLTYSMIENSPDDDFGDDIFSSDEEQDCIVYETQGASSSNTNKNSIVSTLVEMGFAADLASYAIDRCGIDAPIIDLVEIMTAASMYYDSETSIGEDSKGKLPAYELQERCYTSKSKEKRKLHIVEELTIKRHRVISDGVRMAGKQPMILDDDSSIRIPNPMIGFGVPNLPALVSDRKIPAEAEGPPYFYYENVAFTPKGVWPKITSFLYGILPEFVDSKYFSVACRKRGYIHNLPIKGRFQLLPSPPKTIAEALPHTKEHWPSWDPRTQLNCILTCIASAKLTDRIKARVSNPGGPSAADIDYVLSQCRKWNMVWVGKHKVAQLDPDEIEAIMGFPPNHTRGGGISHTERFTLLGNSFQVDTVAYHLSVLKSMFPNGLNVLSLFTGIGGAEVALHRLGIPLRNVVSIEKSKSCARILQDWWDQTDQKGKLVHLPDVQQVSTEQLQAWIAEFGGFDLIIGGSPCNNLAGGNRTSRIGLDGEHSSLFYEYSRIIHTVRELMRGRV